MAIENRRSSTTGGRATTLPKSTRGTTLYGATDANKKTTVGKSPRSNLAGKDSQNWVENFTAPVSKMERKVENFLTQEPIATVGIALGVGLIGGLIFKNFYNDDSSTQSNYGTKRSGARGTEGSDLLTAGASVAFAGFLTKGIAGLVSRAESEFGAFRGGGIAEVKDSLKQIITDELTERPFETIATAVGAGFGIANLETSQVKNGAIRVAKVLAVRTLEGSSSNQLGNQGETNV